MPKAHADVPDDDALFRVEGGVALPLVHTDVPHPQGREKGGVVRELYGVVRVGVVPVFPGELRLGADGFFVVGVGDDVSEDDLCLILHGCPPFLW